jgi:hypothetical protein
LKNEGSADLNFIFDEKFKNKFELEGKLVKFTSHQQLDRFVKKLFEMEIDFKTKHPEEFSLLKSFG